MRDHVAVESETRDRRATRRGAQEPDGETRGRLLSAARALFAARGYRQVTVREICTAADANVAAVNYHFGDKQGLYRDVLDEAIAIMRQTSQEAERAGENRSPEERLRSYIRVFLQRARGGGAPWIHPLMTHELAEPTEALDAVIAQVIEPRTRYLQRVVADMLEVGVEDDRVLRCVMSVQAQFQTAMTNPVLTRLVPGFTGDPASLERLAQHIADFSVGGIRSLQAADTTPDA